MVLFTGYSASAIKFEFLFRSTAPSHQDPMIHSAPVAPNIKEPDFPELPGVPADLPAHDSSPEGKDDDVRALKLSSIASFSSIFYYFILYILVDTPEVL